jgi:hypothetical protein
MNRRAIVLLICFLNLSLAPGSILYAYDDKVVHRKINNNAVLLSNLDNILKNQVGYLNGIETKFNVKEVWEWFEEGGTQEDDPICRSKYHFHDPTKTFDAAGLSNAAINTACLNWGDGSSIVWSQHQGNLWSWQKGREYYYQALTAADKSIREQKFADTFRAVGQIMHLLSDASVPEHVRNDIHILPFFDNPNQSFPQIGSWTYETWCKYNANHLNTATSPIDYSITDTSQVADLVPITNFWDTVFTTGYNLNPVGLAEYTNLNFLSSDTIFKDYAYPMRTDMFTLRPVTAEDNVIDARVYFRGITSDAKNVDYLSSTGYLWSELSAISPAGTNDSRFNLDDKCFEDYAAILVPKAISYSAGLLNYFFRGVIEITLPDNGVYAMTSPLPVDGVAPAEVSFKEIHLMAQNKTANGEAMSNGTIQLVVKYKLAQADPFQSNRVPTSDVHYVVVPVRDRTITGIPANAPVELVFDLSNNPIPLWATDVYLQVVYRGQLGNEADAVAVGFKDISEPTPIGIVNDMDRICIKGTWYAAGSPEAIAQVDSNNNGVADTNEWDVYPHNLQNIYFRFSPITNPQKATTTEYTYNNETFVSMAGSFTNVLYLLTDYEFNMSDQETVVNANADDHYWGWGFSSEAFPVDGVMRQDVLRPSSECDALHIVPNNPCYIQVPPSFITHRGWTIWNAFLYENEPYPADAVCPEE